MRVLILISIFAVAALALSGCGSSGTGSVPSSTPTTESSSSETSRNQSDLATSWERFISSAKSRESDATKNYVKRRRDRPGTVKVKWGITDVVKTDSITSPYVGKVELTVYLTDEFSTGRFQYSLQFVPNGNAWKYKGGKKQRFDRSVTDDAPLDYPELEDEVRVLFMSAS